MIEKMQEIDRYVKNFFDIYKSLGTHESIAPKQVTLELTYRCTAKCDFCCRWSVKPEEVKDELTTEEYQNLIKDLKKVRALRIDLTGGEPLVRKDFFDIVDEVKKCDMEIVLNTNGSLLPRLAKSIAEHGVDSVVVSIDSIYAEKHNTVRKLSKSWENAVEGVKLLKKHGVKVSIGAVLTKKNLDEVGDYIKFARRLGVGFRFQPLHDDSLNGLVVSDKSLLFSENDLDELNEAAETIIRDGKLRWVDETYYRLLPQFSVHPERFKKLKCPAASRTIYFIDPKGDVYPCESRRDLLLGKVREKKFSEIISSDLAKRMREYIYSDKRTCACWYRCTAPDMILYQFPPYLSTPQTGFPVREVWRRKMREINA